MIYISSPCYGSIQPESALSFVKLISVFTDLNLIDKKNPWDQACRDPDEARARNILFHRFLNTKADKMISIDADLVFEPEDILNLLKIDEDIVVPLYKRRCIEEEFIGTPSGLRKNNLIEMKRIGFGISIYKRLCIEKLAKSRTDAGAVFTVGKEHSNYNEKIAEICSHELANGGVWQGIDDVFSDRWHALGGQIWLNPEVCIGHIGSMIFK